MTPQQAAILSLERRWYRTPGMKEADIREEIGVSATRYYQLLTRILDTQEALESDPILVHRLRRIRDQRVNARAHRD